MKKFLFVYEFYSDGCVYFIEALTKWQAIRQFKRKYTFWIDKEFLKIYDVEKLNGIQKL